MNKIQKIQFKNHPVLGDLALDFTGPNDEPVDTVIIAGENGTGKSSVLEALYKLASGHVDYRADVELIYQEQKKNFSFDFERLNQYRKEELMLSDHGDVHTFARGFINNSPYKLNGIFSDVEINFHSEVVSQVGNTCLDENNSSQRSNVNLATDIARLLIDVQSQDNNDFVQEYKRRKDLKLSVDDLIVDPRISRFTRAFKTIFENMEYVGNETRDGKIEVQFKKDNEIIPLESLSSGEKQIVYRGCFLLKNVKSLRGAFVFIDEPEISLHPSWQAKIMDYYKGIFTDENGNQTSQIFVITHSPFVIHNENRMNDKVIILKRNDDGRISLSDKQEYYKCKSVEVVQDAFDLQPLIQNMIEKKSVVYVEGVTDEKYLNRALKVFGYDNVPFVFKTVGGVDKNGQVINSGCKNLDKAAQFHIAQKYPVKTVFLFDCDTQKHEQCDGNIYIKVIKQYQDNCWKIINGIENAFLLDKVCKDEYYERNIDMQKDGSENLIRHLRKTELCDALCAKGNDELKHIFANLKKVIDEIIDIFNE